MFPIQPPDFRGQIRQSSAANFEETLVRQAAQCTGNPQDILNSVKEHNRIAIGQRQLTLQALRDLYFFPLKVKAVGYKVKVSPVHHFLGDFRRTSLYDDWIRQGDLDPGWALAAKRCLAFHWVGWAVCALHNLTSAYHLPHIVVVTAEGPITVSRFADVVRSSEWSCVVESAPRVFDDSDDEPAGESVPRGI